MSAPPSPEEKGKGPAVSELELESAILKGVSCHRPVGKHRHVLMIALQADVHRQTGIWVSTTILWNALREFYDLDALDAMSSSTPSLPPSPDPLSPIPNPRRRRPRARSDSPLSSPSPSPAIPPSRSAQVIDSPHFASVFELPFGRPPSMTPDTTPEMADEELQFGSLLYARARADEEDEEGWDEAVRVQLEADEEPPPAPDPPKRRGRKPKSGTASATASGSASRRTSGGGERGSSPLTSDGEPVLRGRKGSGAATRKRGRASTDTVEEEEARPRARGRRR